MADILDANVVLRHLTQDHSDYGPRASAYFHQIEVGEIEAHLPDLVIFEVAFVLSRFYRQSPKEVQGALLPLIELPGMIVPGKRRFRRIFDLCTDTQLSFVDAYLVVEAERLGAERLVSFDRGFDRIPGITRAEP